jgi:hypothetical protein
MAQDAVANRHGGRIRFKGPTSTAPSCGPSSWPRRRRLSDEVFRVAELASGMDEPRGVSDPRVDDLIEDWFEPVGHISGESLAQRAHRGSPVRTSYAAGARITAADCAALVSGAQSQVRQVTT